MSDPANPREAAIAEIERLGGKVRFDVNTLNKTVFSVNFYETKITDDDLKNLAELRELKALILGGTRVTDAGLVLRPD